MSEHTQAVEKVRFGRTRKNRDEPVVVTARLIVEGRLPLPEFLAILREHAGDVSDDQITVNPGMSMWDAPATDEEVERWRQVDAQQEARHADWRQRMYAELWAENDGQPPMRKSPGERGNGSDR